MPKGKKRSDNGKREKKKERAVRQALKRDRRYLKEGDPEFKSLTDQLAIQGLRLKDVPGDGNCLFRALVDQLPDQTSCYNHRTLRRDIIEYMKSNPHDFAPFMEEDDITFEEYLHDLAQDGTFGGNDIIVAFSRCFNYSIIIHQPNAPRWEVHPEMGVVTDRPSLHIAYLHGEHYCSVKPLEGDVPPRLSSATITSTKPKLPQVSTWQQQTGPQWRLEEYTGMTGMHDELIQVMQSTGCEDPVLAENILQENAYDSQLAILELLQLMDLSESQPLTTSNDTSTTSLYSGQLPSAPSTLLSPKPIVPTTSCTTNAPLMEQGVQQLHKAKKKPSSVQTPCLNQSSQRHLSNRERKEQAKQERKERRLEERRKDGREKKPSADVVDLVGSLAI